MSDTLATRLASVVGAEGVDSWRPHEGAPEVPRAAPDSEESWVEVMRLAAADGLALVPVGHGSRAGWTPPAARVDLALSTRRWDGVVSYEPGDGTIAARAGTSLAELARTVASGGHHLTPEVPHPDRCSLGGTLAAGASGFDRLRYGPVRNALLGVRALLADGTIAQSGGQLVKNVTGYDLHRLYCGSHGTLCVLLEASLRLHPLPAARRLLVRGGMERDEALAAARTVLDLPLRPRAVVVHDHDAPVGSADRGGTPWSLVVALAGRGEVVPHEVEVVRAALPGLEPDEAPDALDRERDRAAGATLELTGRPTDLAAALAAVESARDGLATDLRLSAHPGIACAHVHAAAPLDATAAAALHGALEGQPLRVRWLDAPLAFRREVDPFGPPSPALPLMARLQAALDPGGLFARGRFHGGL